jgi:hypothetical protein
MEDWTMKKSRRRTTSKPARAPKKASSAEKDTCGKAKSTWTILASTKGLTQVWVPTKDYDRVAKDFIKRNKDKTLRRLLKARMAPLSLEADCKGKCDGGWCKALIIDDDREGGVLGYTCECAYFV